MNACGKTQLRRRTAATTLLALLPTLPAAAQQVSVRWAPPSASTMSDRIDALYNYLLVMSGIIAGGVCLLIVVFAYKYRRGAHADRSNAPASNWKLEATWIGIPVLLALFTFGWAARLFFDMYSPPANTIDINVIGQQWFWQLQHPEGQQEINALHVPVGRPVKLTLTSQDVIHSFFVPAFRVKQDVLPGRLTTAWFEATKPGRYHLFCAQYCGTQHANMGGWVYAMPPADYADWLRKTGAQPSLAQQGARLFTQLNCAGCHGPNPSIRAPSLDGLYGKPVPLADGTVTVADERYLNDSILNPGQEVVAGYKNVMPSYRGVITEPQLLQLVAYIRSLGQGSEHEHPEEPLDAATKQRIEEQQRRAAQEQIQMEPRQPPSAVMPDNARRFAPNESNSALHPQGAPSRRETASPSPIGGPDGHTDTSGARP
jgi:cytochrome c oxidase subunit 2